MSSNPAELSNVTEENIDNSALLRNIISTRKSKSHRKYPKIQIAPLRMDDILKELQETYNEPIVSSNVEPIEETIDDSDKGAHSVESSFDMGFSKLSLTTPVKSASQHNDFNLPKPTSRLKPPSSTNHRVLENQFVTPKIQCTVDMKSKLDTPLNRLTAKLNKERQNDNRQNVSGSITNSIDFKRLKVNNTEYVVLSELGKGGSSEVFLCYNVKTKVQHAIKCVSLQNPVSAQGFINEVEVLQRLQKCDRIIKMFDYEINKVEKVLLVVLEVCGADLSRILKDLSITTSHMPMYMLIYYWMEILYAVRQIHQNGIIHSDLKPANFLRSEGCLKLIDFGISSSIQSDMTSVIKPVAEGSFNYISPEALNNEANHNGSPSQQAPKYKISFKSDVWSLGCILYQLVYGRTPFQHVTHLWTKLSKICDPNHTIHYPEAGWVPQKIIKSIQSCLQYNMKLRPSVDDLIADYEASFQNL